jgi:hypothetical protein
VLRAGPVAGILGPCADCHQRRISRHEARTRVNGIFAAGPVLQVDRRHCHPPSAGLS